MAEAFRHKIDRDLDDRAFSIQLGPLRDHNPKKMLYFLGWSTSAAADDALGRCRGQNTDADHGTIDYAVPFSPPTEPVRASIQSGESDHERIDR